MDFTLDPPYGVGALRLGLTAVEARAAVADLISTPGQWPSVSASGELLGHRPGGLGFAVGFDVNGRVNAVEIWRPRGMDTVRYREVDLFGLPALAVVRRLRQHTEVVPHESDGCFLAPDLLLALWRPFATDDDPDEPDGYHFGSVLVARPGYFDTPAEATARRVAGGEPRY